MNLFDKEEQILEARRKATIAVHEYVMLLEEVNPVYKTPEEKVTEIVFHHSSFGAGGTCFYTARVVDR